MPPGTLTAEVQYSWQPFKVNESHLTFAEHAVARLARDRCDWWGPAVYKWQGPITVGPNTGKRGVLIGETGDIRSRIKAYISGTQEHGNKLWRDTFLKRGDIRLYVLYLESFIVSGRAVDASAVLASGNLRM